MAVDLLSLLVGFVLGVAIGAAISSYAQNRQLSALLRSNTEALTTNAQALSEMSKAVAPIPGALDVYARGFNDMVTAFRQYVPRVAEADPRGDATRKLSNLELRDER